MINLREKFRGILSIKDTPHMIAMSFAVGLFVGITPFFGLHIIMGLAFAWAFRLNKLILISAVLVTNPWTMIPIYSFCLWVGMLLMGGAVDVPDIDWTDFTMADLLDGLGQLLVPLFIGTTVVGLAASVASYFFVRSAVCRFRRDRANYPNEGCE